MGFMPRQCVVIEDSDVGIVAAAAAGMKSYRYVKNCELLSHQPGDETLFDDMLQLPPFLLALPAIPN